MSSDQSLSSSSLNLEESSYLTPRIVLRDDKEKEPVQIKIRVKKPKKTRSLERPVCFRVRDGRQLETLQHCPPQFRLASQPRPCVPCEPAYDVAPVVYVNPDGSTRKCGPSGVTVDPDCGCPVEGSAVEKTITKQGSDDEPLVIRIGPTGDFAGNGCDERPVYKINFKDNVMNVTSNIDFMVKKMERSASAAEREPDAQKYLIKPMLKHIPPVTVTVRPYPVGNQKATTATTTTTVSDDRSSRSSRSVPNEYAERPAQTQTRTVLPAQSAGQQFYTPEQVALAYQQQQSQTQPQFVNGQLQVTPEQVAAAYREQQANAPPGSQPEFTPEELAAAYQQQQSGEPMHIPDSKMQVTPDQLAAAFKEQQANNQQLQYTFSPEQMAAAYRQQQAGQPTQPGQMQISPEQLAAAYREQQVAHQAGAAPAQTQYGYQQQPPAPTQYAQPGAQQQYAYPPQQQAQTQYAQQQQYAYQQQPAPTQYAQPGAQQQYAYPQQSAPTQYAQQPAQQPFQFQQFPPQVAAQ